MFSPARVPPLLHSYRLARAGVLRLALGCLVAMGIASCGSATERDFRWFDRSGHRGFVGRGPLHIRWRQPIGPENEGPYLPVERAVASLSPQQDRLYVGSSAGVLYAMNSGGRKLYRYNAGGGIESEPVLDLAQDELYVGTEQGVLHALEASTGKLRWRETSGGPVRHRPLLQKDAVLMVTDADVVTALARTDGSKLWSYQRQPPDGFSISEHSGLTAAGDLLLTAFTDGVVVALNLRDGSVVWERDTSVDVEAELSERPNFVDVDTTPLVVGESVYVASYAGGLYQLDTKSGSVRWHDPRRTGVVSLTRHEDRLYLASAEDGLVCLDLERHEVLWTHGFRRGSPTPPVIVGDLILVGESRGSFYALDRYRGAERSRFHAEHGFSAAPAVAGGRGFVLSNGGDLIAFGG